MCFALACHLDCHAWLCGISSWKAAAPGRGEPKLLHDRAYTGVAYVVMAHIVMAYTGVAYAVMAHIVMAYVVMAHRSCCTIGWRLGL